MERGTIVELRGSWGSGIATLVLDTDKGRVYVPCDNGITVRALNAAFPGFITDGHCVDNSVIEGQEIAYATDDLGLTLAGFNVL